MPNYVMFDLRLFEYSIDPVKCEMDRAVYDTLIFCSETAIETNRTEVIRKWYGTDMGETGEEEDTNSLSVILHWLNTPTQK